MQWNVEFTDEFEAWWNTLDKAEQVSIDASVRLLIEYGPHLARPHSDTLNGSSHRNMKELRTQHEGRPYRSFYAFDSNRSAILLIGGDKTGDNRFYDRMISVADKLFDTYLAEIKQEEQG